MCSEGLWCLVRGPAFWNIDQAVFKDFKLTERISSQFRVEVYDLPNHAFLANPGTDPTSTATFGTITAKGSTAVASSTSAASVAQRSFQLVIEVQVLTAGGGTSIKRTRAWRNRAAKAPSAI
jgi:hypothetical protein